MQVIETRWRALPRNQCDGIRKYIVGLIIKLSSVQENLERERVYLRKLNFILVQVRRRCRACLVAGGGGVVGRDGGRFPRGRDGLMVVWLLLFLDWAVACEKKIGVDVNCF